MPMVERNFILFAFPVSILVSLSLGTNIYPNCKLVVSLSHENCLYSGCKEHISVAQQKRPIYSNNIHWKGKNRKRNKWPQYKNVNIFMVIWKWSQVIPFLHGIFTISYAELAVSHREHTMTICKSINHLCLFQCLCTFFCVSQWAQIFGTKSEICSIGLNLTF